MRIILKYAKGSLSNYNGQEFEVEQTIQVMEDDDDFPIVFHRIIVPSMGGDVWVRASQCINAEVAVRKITSGYVVQEFNLAGELISQEFVAENCEYENGAGTPIELSFESDYYHDYNMEQ